MKQAKLGKNNPPIAPLVVEKSFKVGNTYVN